MKTCSFMMMAIAIFCLTLFTANCGDDDDSNSEVNYPADDDDDDGWLPGDDDSDDDGSDDDDDDASDDDDDDGDDRLDTNPENVGYYEAVKITMAFPDPSSGQDKDVDVYYPTKDGVTICIDFGLRPVVIFGPDGNLQKSLYASYGTHLATWGYITIIRNNFTASSGSLADTNSAIIDWIMEELENQDSIFYHTVDMNKFLAAGHGLGGKTAVLSAFRDKERILATIAIDPNDITSFGDDPSVTPDLMSFINQPGQYFGAALGGDCVPEEENYAQYFFSAKAPAYEYEMLDAGHHAFVDNPNCLACQCEAGTADPDSVKLLTQGLMIAFLNVHIRHWDEFDFYLTGLGVEQDANMGKLTYRYK